MEEFEIDEVSTFETNGRSRGVREQEICYSFGEGKSNIAKGSKDQEGIDADVEGIGTTIDQWMQGQIRRSNLGLGATAFDGDSGRKTMKTTSSNVNTAPSAKTAFMSVRNVPVGRHGQKNVHG